MDAHAGFKGNIVWGSCAQCICDRRTIRDDGYEHRTYPPGTSLVLPVTTRRRCIRVIKLLREFQLIGPARNHPGRRPKGAPKAAARSSAPGLAFTRRDHTRRGPASHTLGSTRQRGRPRADDVHLCRHDPTTAICCPPVSGAFSRQHACTPVRPTPGGVIPVHSPITVGVKGDGHLENGGRTLAVPPLPRSRPHLRPMPLPAT